MIDYRLQNIYDLASSSHLFLLKFAIPESKKHVIVDPGFRIHLTEYARQTTPAPSGFVAKLRKHLKTRRLTRIDVGQENRLLSLSFNNTFYLVIEFFAGGNMILLDENHKIMCLQRVVSATEKQARCAVNETYPLNEYLQGASVGPLGAEQVTVERVKSWLQPAANVGKKDKPTLARVLYMNNPATSGTFVEQCLAEHNLDGKSKNLADVASNEQALNEIVQVLSEARSMTELMLAQRPIPGCVVGERNPKFAGTPSESTRKTLSPEDAVDINSVEVLYNDFLPILAAETESDTDKIRVYTTSFNQAIDIYFSTIEATRASIRLNNQETQAAKRLQAAQDEKEKRVKGLETVQQQNNEKGHALQAYANRVEETMEAIRGLMDQGMDWTDIGNLIKLEQQRRNPLAQMIKLPLNLAKNRITVKVPIGSGTMQNVSNRTDSSSDSEDESSDEEDNQVDRYLDIEVDLDLSVYANARNYFEVKKTAAAKQERTVQQADVAYKSAEKKIKRDLQKALEKNAQNTQQMHVIREPLWFEKFYWFITSDGFLCLGGRDVVQNDLLLRKYFTSRDLLVHSDVAGAPIVVIKNHHHEQAPTKVISPSSLVQAGIFCVASSQAWEQKMAASSWWATRDQIPKVSAEGDIVTSEFLVVNGDKNYLPPCQLDMGLGFMWLIPEVEVEEEEVVEVESDEEFPDVGFDEEFPDEEFPDVDVDEIEQESIEPEIEQEENDQEVEQENDREVEQENDQEVEQVENEPETEKPDSPEIEQKENEQEIQQEDNDQEIEEKESEEEMLDIEKQLESLKTGTKEKAGQQKPPKTRKKKKGKTVVEEKPKAKGKPSKQEVEEKKKAADKLRRERQQKAKEIQQRKIREELEQEYQGEQDFEFKRLVGKFKTKPSEGTILQAVPVFGPWSSMHKIKYKVKVQAGLVKKGKAVKEMLHALSKAKTDASETDADYAWGSELRAISNVREQEILQCMSVTRVRLGLGKKGGRK